VPALLGSGTGAGSATAGATAPITSKDATATEAVIPDSACRVLEVVELVVSARRIAVPL
jgi:hypothetical protein